MLTNKLYFPLLLLSYLQTQPNPSQTNIIEAKG